MKTAAVVVTLMLGSFSWAQDPYRGYGGYGGYSSQDAARERAMQSYQQNQMRQAEARERAIQSHQQSQMRQAEARERAIQSHQQSQMRQAEARERSLQSYYNSQNRSSGSYVTPRPQPQYREEWAPLIEGSEPPPVFYRDGQSGSFQPVTPQRQPRYEQFEEVPPGVIIVPKISISQGESIEPNISISQFESNDGAYRGEWTPTVQNGSRTTSYDGMTIPHFATEWRVRRDGRVEYRPTEDPKSVAVRERARRAAFDQLETSLQASANEYVAGLHTNWNTKFTEVWIPRLADSRKKVTESLAVLTPDFVRARALKEYEGFWSLMDVYLTDIATAMSALDKGHEALKREISAAVTTGHSGKASDADVRTQVMSELINPFREKNNRELSILLKRYNDNGVGLKSDYERLPRPENVVATFQKRYQPYAALVTEYTGKSTEDDIAWKSLWRDQKLENQTKELKSWKASESKLLAEEENIYPHVKRKVEPFFTEESKRRDAFIATVTSLTSDALGETGDYVSGINAIVETAFTADTPVESARKKLDDHWQLEIGGRQAKRQKVEDAWKGEVSWNQFAGVAKLIQTERSRYPLKEADSNCQTYTFRVELEGEKTRLAWNNRDDEDTILFAYEGRRSFACAGDVSVVILDKITELKDVEYDKAVLGEVMAKALAGDSRGFAVKLSGKTILDIVPSPTATITLAKVRANAEGNGFNLAFTRKTETGSEPVTKFGYLLNTKDNVIDQGEILEFPSDPEFWEAK